MNDFEIVIDYILEIRKQDTVCFQAVFTIFVGAVLAGILVAVVRRSDGTGKKLISSRDIWCFVLSCTALVLFFIFILAVNNLEHEKMDFGIKWIGNRISSTENARDLIKQYSKDYCGIIKNDAVFVWKFIVCPLASLLTLLLSQFLRRLGPKHEKLQSEDKIGII